MKNKPGYKLAGEEFVIENYQFAKPFANFFPGIAGKWGIPMWTFYVNRGQCISSFGVKGKDHPILEFYPANKAWQNTPSLGFRTFIKVISGKKPSFYEPFSINNPATSSKMSISSSGLVIEEENSALGLKISVECFNIPNDSYAGLARIVRIKNLSRKKNKIQLLDGLPQIVPFGTNNFFLKEMCRTIEAWMGAENLEKGVPFLRLKVDPSDKPEVVHLKEGHFYLTFNYEKDTPKIIRPIVNPENVFGPATDFSQPLEFTAGNNFKFPKTDIVKSKTPCVFNLLDLALEADEVKTFYSVIGYMRSIEELNASIKKIASDEYLMLKKAESKKVIRELQQDIQTQSSSREFDLYAKQTYLDNILRGGTPLTFKNGAVFYLYSRKHGDLERDYNRFLIQPTYFSQGNGNYRDVNQNRRCDVFFNPEVKDENIISFFNLLQLDGFNPLMVKGASFLLRPHAKLHLDEKLEKFLQKPFTPGDLILFIQDNNIKLSESYDEFLERIIARSDKIQEAEHGEGFWTDHWHYNLDLLESYSAVYPEKLKELIFEKKEFSYFDNSEVVRPRAEKYVLYHGECKQLHAVHVDPAKKKLIGKRHAQSHVVHAELGRGKIYQTTLVNKLLCLLANKLASLDPFGVGIEMEANKPNWFDALNGLPALFGSSSCETFEVKRLALLIKDAFKNYGTENIKLCEEVRQFLIALNDALKSSRSDFEYWDRSSSLKEEFRAKTKMGVSGREIDTDAELINEILDNALKKIEHALESAKDNPDIYRSYFFYKTTEFKTLDNEHVMPTKFTQVKVPYFLEAQMHALRLSNDPGKAKSIYQATKKSDLFDKKLKMYKVTAPLDKMPEEIGRCTAFSPGWLENESIWLHMEYKYLLETLKQGLYEEFYSDFKNCLVPFQKPQVYGRSILENSSFIVSSAFADKEKHGNGFVARLSGSTAEFIQMWLVMNVGLKPFFLNEKGELNLRFAPKLAGWLFDRKGNYRFRFLGKIDVAYHNPERKNTFGKNAAKITKIAFDGKEIVSDTIPAPYAEQIRSRHVKKIDIYLE